MKAKQESRPIIGSYVPTTKQNQYLVGALQEAESYQASAMMIFTGAPQAVKKVPLTNFNIPEFKTRLKTSVIKIEHVIIHAGYLINLGNTKKPSTFHFGCQQLLQ